VASKSVYYGIHSAIRIKANQNIIRLIPGKSKKKNIKRKISTLKRQICMSRYKKREPERTDWRKLRLLHKMIAWSEIPKSHFLPTDNINNNK
jgi:hypothetical protein